MEQPEEYVVSGKYDHLCLLRKSSYSLKQPHRQWYLRFDSFMIKHAYNRCNYDYYMYFKETNE